MTAPAIEVENLGKRYFLGEGPSRRGFAHAALPWLRNRATREFWALRDVTLSVQEGESVGIIGRNGAGKSTLLKILSRITAPTEGRARVRGRMGTLLEVGTGFHPDLSGRDNIFLSGTILGLSYREVRQKFDEIVAFAEVEQFIDTPVKRYSSGMYVRLAFAVAMFLDPDILIVDEVLAVGDLAFQRKSVGRLNEAAHKEGRTVLFVSHSLQAVQKFCQRVIVLDRGRMTFDGQTEEGIEHYTKAVPEVDVANVGLSNRLQRSNGEVRITKVAALDADRKGRWSYWNGETVAFRLDFEAVHPVPNLALLFQLDTVRDEMAYVPEVMVTRGREVISRERLQAGHRGTVEIVFRNLKLRRGQFALYFYLADVDGEKTYDVIDQTYGLPHLTIKSEPVDRHDRVGIVSMDYHFQVLAGEARSPVVESVARE